MRYTFFEVSNFKGIRNARLDLESASQGARIYTLVGLNESGKTTILDAIDHFQPTTDDGDVSPKFLAGWRPPDKHQLIPIADRTNFNGTISITCGIELDDDDVTSVRHHLRRTANGFNLIDMERKLTITDNYTYENSVFKTKRTRWTGLSATGRARTGTVLRTINASTDTKWQAMAAHIRRNLPVVWFFPNFLFDFPDHILLEEFADESDTNRFYRALFQDILDALERDVNVEDHVVARAKSNKASEQQNLQQVLLEASRHVRQTVVAAWNRIFADKPITEMRVHISYGLDGDEEDADVYIEFKLEDADGFFSVRERSLGFRWFFVYLLMTAYRGRRKGSSSDILFLFDEPASNLHQTAQQALLNSFEDLAERAVIIYTTHSHHLINPMWLGTAFVVANEGLGDESVSTSFNASRTDIVVHPYRQFAADHPNQAHFFQPILDVLDYAPSGLEFVPSVVMVEGKRDFYLLSYFQEIILKVPPEKQLGFLPGGGAGTLDEPIQLYLGWARPFVALLDSDASGNRERQRYLEKFGSILDGRLISLAAVAGDSKVRGIESLLSTADRLAIQAVTAPTSRRYTKKAFARGVQEALITKTDVKISASGTRAVKRVLEGLAAALASAS